MWKAGKYGCNFKCGQFFGTLTEKFAHMRECLKGKEMNDAEDALFPLRGRMVRMRVPPIGKTPKRTGGVAKNPRKRTKSDR